MSSHHDDMLPSFLRHFNLSGVAKFNPAQLCPISEEVGPTKLPFSKRSDPRDYCKMNHIDLSSETTMMDFFRQPPKQ
jgi:hypothetical protein